MIKLTVVAVLVLLLVAPDASAYLDPGSGSAILQGILGALAAIALALKLYWHRLLRLLGVRKPLEKTGGDSGGNSDRAGESDHKSP